MADIHQQSKTPIMNTPTPLPWWRTWYVGVILGLLLAVPYVLLRVANYPVGGTNTCASMTDVLLSGLHWLAFVGMGVVARYNYLLRPDQSPAARWRELLLIVLVLPGCLALLLNQLPACLRALW